MFRIDETLSLLEDDKGSHFFSELYGMNGDILVFQKERYKNLLNEHQRIFGSGEIDLFSSPGRTEIGGNHTDHNHGKVLAASISLDCVGVASKNNDNIIRIHDITYNEDISINVLEAERKEGEKGSLALVRGLVSGFLNYGFLVGGFDLSVSSNVISAAGVSSSAAFEMLICKIMDRLYNVARSNVEMTKVNYSLIGKYAENKYWDKQSGLLDQMSCAFGGILTIDFKNSDEPLVEKIEYDFSAQNYDLLLVNTGGNHADLSQEYSAVPGEMKEVAKELGVAFLGEATLEKLLEKIGEIRTKTGDRAVIRALHFYEENKKVDSQVKALKENNFEEFLKLITASGNSSWKWLQNCYCTSNIEEQGICYYLALTEIFINQKQAGACRVHGGGFAGVIAAYLPQSLTNEYVNYMERITGSKSIYKMSIRNYGVVSFSEMI